MFNSKPDTFATAAPLPLAPQAMTPSALGYLLKAKALLEHDPHAAHDLLDRVAELISCPAAVQSPPPAPGMVEAARPGGLAKWQRRKVMAFVEANLSQAIQVRELAALVNLSTGYFSRAFKISTSETPHNHILRQRVRRAQILLASTDEPISEIAILCGFSDQAHLTRCFGRGAKCTPLVWRKAFRGEIAGVLPARPGSRTA
ncbi:helix-turn-helix domain-containing protein [bacterium]|nr:helix-turn-helix domain-containing protein [bacterium]